MKKASFYALVVLLLAACRTQPGAAVTAVSITPTSTTQPTATAVPPTPTGTAQPPATAVPATVTPEPITASEQPIQAIPLDGPMAAASAEISGLAWYGEMLILLPQFPSRFGDQLFALSKADILAFLDGARDGPLTPQPIPLVAPDLTLLTGYEGVEAIAFHGDQVFVTIETSGGAPMLGYLAAGHIVPDLS
ncbi:MAG: hypothetical protein P8183_17045, partial [Anaerolineae bacterium]